MAILEGEWVSSRLAEGQAIQCKENVLSYSRIRANSNTRCSELSLGTEWKGCLLNRLVPSDGLQGEGDKKPFAHEQAINTVRAGDLKAWFSTQ